LDKKAKITVIGAGSAAFGLSTLVGNLRHPALQGVSIFA
jgi:alpha-galactosidase/6-phospho-beta-glucosidase family protein